MRRVLYLLTAWMMLALGIAGVFLPLLPTTPFLLVSSYCFARSSPQMRHWLLNHRLFGRYLRDWEEQRGVRRSVKVLAVTLVVLVVSAIWLGGERPAAIRWLVTLLAGVGLVVVWRLPVIAAAPSRVSDGQAETSGPASEASSLPDVIR